MISGGETDVDVKVLAESRPETRRELRATIQNYILGESVEMEDLFQKNLRGFKLLRSKFCCHYFVGIGIYFSVFPLLY